MDVINLGSEQLFYCPDWLSAGKARRLFTELLDKTCWRQDEITLFGKIHQIPRLQAWYGDVGTEYQYSGLQLVPEPWPENLRLLCEPISKEAGVAFNSVLVNLYRDGRDSNGWHADNEPELGCKPVIASLSLGSVRRFRLRNIADHSRTLSLDLLPGSLLIMGEGVQENWQHQLAKTRKYVEPRINLTFRRIHQSQVLL